MANPRPVRAQTCMMMLLVRGPLKGYVGIIVEYGQLEKKNLKW